MTEGLGLEEGLFSIDAPPPVSLADRFGVPPFTLLDRRGGTWTERKRRWLSMGIRSELGRDGGLIYDGESGMGQGILPMRQWSERALEAAALGVSEDAKRAGRELERRRSGKRGDAGAPVPGSSGGGGAWFGKKADGSAGYMDAKWDDLGEARKRLNEAGAHKDQDKLNAIMGNEMVNGTSVFDPVLCELAYRWFTAPGMTVLDPFAGGSVRGVVASVLQRHYLGIELRERQVLANREQAVELCAPEWRPRYLAADSRVALDRVPAGSVDFMWSCPPYADLEVYSNDPADISGMEYGAFVEAHADIIGKACRALREDRFAAWVISDVRDKGGHYRGLVHETVRAFEAAGLHFYNEAVILDPVGSAAIRSGRIFLGGRKLTRMHQFMLVFVKGSWKRATQALATQEQVLESGEGAEE